MKSTILIFTAVLTVFLTPQVFANSAPVVSGVSASQRGDDSKLVDIYYDLADADSNNCTIWLQASDNGGLTYHVPLLSVSGQVGSGIVPGTNKHVIWDAGTDMPGYTGNFRVRVFATDGNPPTDMVLAPAGLYRYQGAQWIYIEGFYIDKFEVTNAKYCQFLNEDDPAGNYYFSSMEIIQTGTPGIYSYTVIPGKGNYPIRYANLYDAQAYASWKSNQTGQTYRLPTEQEWEKAAGWDPIEEHHYIYSFHQDTINCNWCNYNNCVGSLREVGYYDGVNPNTNDAKSYYGCYDMSGNLFEWTSSIYSGSNQVIRGGLWSNSATLVTVTYRSYDNQLSRDFYIGFRLIVDLD